MPPTHEPVDRDTEPFLAVFGRLALRTVVGRRRNGMRVGTWRGFDHYDELVVEGEFDDDVLRGTMRCWFPEGRGHRATIEVVDGAAHGRWLETNLDGSSFEALARRGAFHGPSTEWWPGGEPRSSGAYRKGNSHGTWTWWHPNGVVRANGRYCDGKKDGRWTFRDEHSHVTSQWMYRRGSREGLQAEWWPGRVPRASVEYRDDRRHGTYRAWFDSGELACEGRFTRGRRVGRWRLFLPDGSPAPSAPSARVAARRSAPHRASDGDLGIQAAELTGLRPAPPVARWLRQQNLHAHHALEHTLELQGEIADVLVECGEGRELHHLYDHRGRLVERDGARFHARREPGGGATLFVESVARPRRRTPPPRRVVDLHRGAARTGTVAVSGDGRLVAWTVDQRGDERHVLNVARVADGRLLDVRVSGVSSEISWSADGALLLYRPIDQWSRSTDLRAVVVSERGRCSTRRVLGLDAPSYVEASTTASGNYLVVARHRRDGFNVVDLRSMKISWFQTPHPVTSWDELHDEWAAVDEAGAVWTCPGERAWRLESWRLLVPARPGCSVTDLHVAYGCVVLGTCGGGSAHVECVPLAGGKPRRLLLGASCAQVHIDVSHDGRVVRVCGSGPTLEGHWTTHDMVRATSRRSANPAARADRRFASRTITARSADGSSVDVTLLHHAQLDADRPAPTILYGYGSHNVPTLARFSQASRQLCAAGFVLGIAHVRGGGEHGPAWWRAGIGLDKQRGFDDFIAAADELVACNITRRRLLVVRGRSAGGLLVLAAITQRPDLCHAAIAEYPVAAPLTSMGDPALPFGERWDVEFGDVHNPLGERVIRSWSPLDALAPVAYPHVLLTAGVYDRRVLWWEAARFAHRLRALRADSGMTLLKTALEWGHYEPDDPSVLLGEQAFQLAFVHAALARPLVSTTGR